LYVRREVREDIYKKRQKLNGKLSSSLPSVNAQIGNSIAQPTKIFINESLTGYIKRLFGKVQEYRRRFGYKLLWTVNGKILLRQAESSTVHCFSTDEELNSEYYSLPKLNQLFDKYSSSDNISLFHFNIRSLPKNISILNDFLYTLNSIGQIS
jgi:hypothetical protein